MTVTVNANGVAVVIEIDECENSLEAINRELLEVEVDEPDPPRAIAVGAPATFEQFLALF